MRKTSCLLFTAPPRFSIFPRSLGSLSPPFILCSILKTLIRLFVLLEWKNKNIWRENDWWKDVCCETDLFLCLNFCSVYVDVWHDLYIMMGFVVIITQRIPRSTFFLYVACSRFQRIRRRNMCIVLKSKRLYPSLSFLKLIFRCTYVYRKYLATFLIIIFFSQPYFWQRIRFCRRSWLASRRVSVRNNWSVELLRISRFSL